VGEEKEGTASAPATLSVDVISRAPERVEADALVTPFFESDRPLRGPAARADWRLCNLLSERLIEGRVRGELGEQILMPAGRTLRARVWLAVGLGPRGACGAPELRTACAAAGAQLLGLRIASAALALPPEASTGLAVDRAVSAVLEGMTQALEGRTGNLELILVVAEDELRRARSQLAAHASQSERRRGGAEGASDPRGVSRSGAIPR